MSRQSGIPQDRHQLSWTNPAEGLNLIRDDNPLRTEGLRQDLPARATSGIRARRTAAEKKGPRNYCATLWASEDRGNEGLMEDFLALKKKIETDSFYLCHFRYFVCQVEVGDSHQAAFAAAMDDPDIELEDWRWKNGVGAACPRLHLQIYFQLGKGMGFRKVKSILLSDRVCILISRAHNPKTAADYCKKQDTRYDPLWPGCRFPYEFGNLLIGTTLEEATALALNTGDIEEVMRSCPTAYARNPRGITNIVNLVNQGNARGKGLPPGCRATTGVWLKGPSGAGKSRTIAKLLCTPLPEVCTVIEAFGQGRWNRREALIAPGEVNPGKWPEMLKGCLPDKSSGKTWASSLYWPFNYRTLKGCFFWRIEDFIGRKYACCDILNLFDEYEYDHSVKGVDPTCFNSPVICFTSNYYPWEVYQQCSKKENFLAWLRRWDDFGFVYDVSRTTTPTSDVTTCTRVVGQPSFKEQYGDLWTGPGGGGPTYNFGRGN